jgi:tetratricopeptide (TPR) repeat protein
MPKPTSKKIPVKSPAAGKKKAEPQKSGNIFPVILLLIITFFCYSNSLNNEFTNWDDPGYVLDNTLIKKLDAQHLKDIFITPVMGNYHPLAVLSLALDYKFYRLEPFGYHLTNLILHLLNTILVYFFFRMLSGRMLVGFITAILFGVHAMHVESVSWVAERKDVLYVLFYFASLCSYLLIQKQPARKTLYYSLTLFFFLLSLLSKAQAVTLPVVLILIDYFKGSKLTGKTLINKIPFFLISIFSGVMAIIAQKESGAIADIPIFPFYQRIFFAAYSFLAYVYKLILPVNLSAYYPYPDSTSSIPVYYYIAPVFVLVLLFIIYKFWKNNKAVVFGVLFYIFNIALLLQILPVGGSVMSERYSYLSYTGLFFIIGFLFDKVWNSPGKESGNKYVFAVLLFSFILFNCFQTYARNKVWKNSETLWTNTIRQFPRTVIAFSNRGSYYQKKEKLDLALADFNEALRLKNNHTESLINRADIYRLRGQYDLAIADCNKAIQTNPKLPGAYINRGISYCITGKYDEGFQDFVKVIQLDPKYPNSYCNRGNLYDMRGQLDSAISDYTLAISLKPDYSEAYYNRGKTHMKKQNYDAALNDFTNAIGIKKDYFEAFYFRSQVFKTKKEFGRALEDALMVKNLGKPIDEAYINELQMLAGK